MSYNLIIIALCDVFVDIVFQKHKWKSFMITQQGYDPQQGFIWLKRQQGFTVEIFQQDSNK
jgi:hypothetical protein